MEGSGTLVLVLRDEGCKTSLLICELIQDAFTCESCKSHTILAFPSVLCNPGGKQFLQEWSKEMEINPF